ncbi:GHKL domain-containing protein [Campylobacter lari]|nr:sensor histidine kinase [Campylobacter lari]EAL3898291.1 GHKL domain-containing protein [Campylobacter lari]EAL7139811.1 GHKL domain-containing protein [Campylobacter lari]EHC3132092.1 sensor histidine kinase [Campylobacter lari]EHY1327945.1 sensor histidine kinase [Campylobacter lari]
MKEQLHIRPEARLIKTIGEDLIKNPYAAVVELIKNSYDADSEIVIVSIELTNEYVYDKKQKFLKFTIEDDGEGMSLETIKNTWMVPATSYKVNKQYSSKKKRVVQGKKGIGRYASAILGDFLRITTTDLNGMTSIIEIDWKQFDDGKFLDEINIPYECNRTNLKSGTKIEIYSSIEVYYDVSNQQYKNSINWNDNQNNLLFKELRKLLVPVNKSNEIFEIRFSTNGLIEFGIKDKNEKIEPFPLLDSYEYRIKGKISSNGKGLLFYENKNFENSNEKIELDLHNICGNIEVDLRVFDLDPDVIQNLVNEQKGKEEKLGKSEFKALIKEFSGVGIYRNLFRIRPYGDHDFDWLGLNARRVNSPTMSISTNQVAGFVSIESENKSNLIEKSDREGLKENENYDNLKKILLEVLIEVERRRYEFRKNTKRGRVVANNIKDTIRDVFSFDDVNNKISVILHKANIDAHIIEKVQFELKQEEIKKNNGLKNIEEVLAMYEAHAALGKLVLYVLHEGRKPMQIIGLKLNNLKKSLQRFIKTKDENIEQDIKKYNEDSLSQLEKLSNLFKRLDPLMITRSSRRKEVNLYQNALSNYELFKEILKKENIDFEIQCENKELFIYGRDEDLYIIYSNLIENSLYWFQATKQMQKKITISIYRDSNYFYIDYKDNGIGIKKEYANLIFDPGFSTKPEGGTGIGLTIVGQAVSRNDGEIKYIRADEGVYFKISFKDTQNEQTS